MRSWNKNNTAILLIFSSLSFLLLFLSSWIHGVYTHEKQALEKEISYTFKDVINVIEDSIIQKVFLEKITLDVKSPGETFKRVKRELTFKMDSVEVIGTSSRTIQKEYKSDSLHMFVATMEEKPANMFHTGLLPILIDLEVDTAYAKIDTKAGIKKIIDLISDQFQQEIQKSDLPKTYKIVELTNEANPTGLVSTFYEFPDEGVSYAAIFQTYFWYVISKMKHQLLFASLLLAAISASFFIIYNNWRKQQKLIDIKNDFISNVTHELKTPISTVSVALEALSRFDVVKNKDKTAEYLAISKLELNRLRILVDKVLKMSIFEKGATQLSLEKFDLAVLLNEVLSSMKIQFEKVEAHVQSQLDGEDFTIEADKIHMTNVLYNLLDNAIKYSPQGPKIDILLKESNGFLDINIKDQGLGISKEDQSHIFDRFYRVPTGDTHNIKGHGLGLSYVATIINQHNGKINLESELNKGSKFSIRLNKYVEN
jgi:signal transduction histidine kinase